MAFHLRRCLVERARGVLVAAAALFLAAAGLACAPSGEPQPVEPTEPAPFAYAAGVPLVTTNAISAAGVSARADMISARIYPGVFVRGPSGQYVPNLDFATANFLPGTQRSVLYRINVDAVYSDGVPVTCTDFMLTWRAATMPWLFSSFAPVYDAVDRVDCDPGQRKFTVYFKEGMGARWHELFASGTVLASHVFADRLNIPIVELNRRLKGGDTEELRPVAEIWNTGFNLDNLDRQLQVASGPYMIVDSDPGVSVTLGPNPAYRGDAPAIGTITIYAFGQEPTGFAGTPAPAVSDLTHLSRVAWLDDRADTPRYSVSSGQGMLTEQLVLAEEGTFADAELRRAFSGCVDQAQVAEVASEASGVTVSPVGLFLSAADDPASEKNSDIAAAHTGIDPLATTPLAGHTIRIAHLPGHRRFALMVDQIRATCAPWGITVTDATGPASSLADLKRAGRGEVDAFLVPLAPASGFATVDPDSGDPEQIREEENRLWQTVPSIPLNAEPRAFIVEEGIGNVMANTGLAGLGWNMDRWTDTRQPAPPPASAPG
ncbi:ABC transporter substrate-binding protein [Corynebacterium mendelii]|uniref:Peptide ABC transporter n=1 Tax=Corynebacterium mendelii TaxID=2765362 RepID=A0A939E0A8_9CORY|nr:ABC transporter substrate-binding protein [Corynebacterium mendelii]MBN9643381.1 peptide ABC transporter [Corynebacterium mendelii]